MTISSAWRNAGSIESGDSNGKKLMAELLQMSRISMREEGLLNHAQAAAVLDVSARRIAELVELGKLCRFDFLGRTYVSVREVLERRSAELKAGRPRGSVAQKIRRVAKILGNYDAANALIDGITPLPKKQQRKK
jgi:hypothetical protein